MRERMVRGAMGGYRVLWEGKEVLSERERKGYCRRVKGCCGRVGDVVGR